jgi:hypothetical protein
MEGQQRGRIRKERTRKEEMKQDWSIKIKKEDIIERKGRND